MQREPLDAREQVPVLVADVAGLGERLVAVLLDVLDQVRGVVEVVLEARAQDDRHGRVEVPEIRGQVAAQAHGRAREHEADVADRVEQREREVAADRQERRRAVRELDAEQRVTEHLEELRQFTSLLSLTYRVWRS